MFFKSITKMPFTYKSVLLVGATSGIGAGLADKFIAEGSQVIAVGRRQDKLDDFVKKHNSANAAAIRYDITDSAGLNAFVDKYIRLNKITQLRQWI